MKLFLIHQNVHFFIKKQGFSEEKVVKVFENLQMCTFILKIADLYYKIVPVHPPVWSLHSKLLIFIDNKLYICYSIRELE